MRRNAVEQTKLRRNSCCGFTPTALAHRTNCRDAEPVLLPAGEVLDCLAGHRHCFRVAPTVDGWRIGTDLDDLASRVLDLLPSEIDLAFATTSSRTQSFRRR